MEIPTPEQIVASIEAFCARHGMAETRFGRDATGEPQLLASIRAGRSPSLKVLHRCAKFMRDHEKQAAKAALDSEMANEAHVPITSPPGDGPNPEWPLPSATKTDQDIRGSAADGPPAARRAPAGEADPRTSSPPAVFKGAVPEADAA